MVGEVRRQFLAGVGTAYVEDRTGPGHPGAEPRRRALVLVLDDENRRAHSGTRSRSASQARAFASDGIRQSPRGESDPPAETFGPFGRAERLN